MEKRTVLVHDALSIPYWIRFTSVVTVVDDQVVRFPDIGADLFRIFLGLLYGARLSDSVGSDNIMVRLCDG